MAQLFTSSACNHKSSSASNSDSSPYPLSDLSARSSPYQSFSAPLSTYSSSLASSSTSSLSRTSTFAAEMQRSSTSSSRVSGKDEKFGFPRSATTNSDHKQPTRRRTNEHKMNVHTACGRHSNDWLFGGFSVSGTMKMLWEKKE